MCGRRSAREVKDRIGERDERGFPGPEPDPRLVAREGGLKRQRVGRNKIDRRERLARLARRLIVWTVLSHITVAMAATEAARCLRLPGAPGVGIGAAVLLCLALRPAILAMISDRIRPSFRVRWLELPYFAHWCAASLAWMWMVGVGLIWLGVWVFRGTGPFSMPQQALFSYAAGLAVSLWGIVIERRRLAVTHLRMAIRGLGRGFDGYRIVQMSDLHLGSFVSQSMASKWVDVANRLSADLVVVTGDLATSGVHFDVHIGRLLGQLRAGDGVVVAAGNHDHWGTEGKLFHELAARGVRVLRNSHFVVERSGSRLVIAGVDDAVSGRAELGSALADRPPNVPTVLLTHDPGLFPEAAHASVELVLSGHTHGGQVAFPLLGRWLNLSRLSHRFHRGMYREGGSTLYVNRGLGTTGPPIRLGATPEITVVELHSATEEEA
jgi:uncharacterized protein